AQVGSEKYYLLSTSPSATKNVLGWMKAKDLSTHSHKGHSKTPRALKIKGTDKATSKAWGGGKDTVHASMSKYKGEMLHVNLNEKVGNNTRYRGKINEEGKNIWLNSSNEEKMDIKAEKKSLIDNAKGRDRTDNEEISG